MSAPAGSDPPDRPRRSRGHWIVLALAACGILALALLGLATRPAEAGHGTHEQLGLGACAAMESFGLPCPGCGVTTSVSLLARGRPVDSLRTQPFGFLLALGAVAFAAWTAWGHSRGRDLYLDLRTRDPLPWAILAGAALIAAWIYKILQVCGG